MFGFLPVEQASKAIDDAMATICRSMDWPRLSRSNRRALLHGHSVPSENARMARAL
jgi:hypothetical protein